MHAACNLQVASWPPDTPRACILASIAIQFATTDIEPFRKEQLRDLSRGTPSLRSSLHSHLSMNSCQARRLACNLLRVDKFWLASCMAAVANHSLHIAGAMHPVISLYQCDVPAHEQGVWGL